MLETLNNRLQKRLDDYLKLINNERKMQEVLDKIIPLFPPDTNMVPRVYGGTSFLYIYPADVFQFELETISKISDIFNVKWSKNVKENDVSYTTNIQKPLEIYIIISPVIDNTCTIQKVYTGKSKPASKVVIVDEEQFDYVVNCKEDF